MKTLMRHGLAVCLVLTTMCTSLLLMYSSIGGGGPKEPSQQQQQVAVAASGKPETERLGSSQQRRRLPVGAGLLEGYISVLDHKEGKKGHICLHQNLERKFTPELKTYLYTVVEYSKSADLKAS